MRITLVEILQFNRMLKQSGSSSKMLKFLAFLHVLLGLGVHGAHRSKITKKVHKPPRNHYIEWPVFSDIGLNCESQGEKGKTCEKYQILIGS